MKLFFYCGAISAALMIQPLDANAQLSSNSARSGQGLLGQGRFTDSYGFAQPRPTFALPPVQILPSPAPVREERTYSTLPQRTYPVPAVVYPQPPQYQLPQYQPPQYQQQPQVQLPPLPQYRQPLNPSQTQGNVYIDGTPDPRPGREIRYDRVF